MSSRPKRPRRGGGDVITGAVPIRSSKWNRLFVANCKHSFDSCPFCYGSTFASNLQLYCDVHLPRFPDSKPLLSHIRMFYLYAFNCCRNERWKHVCTRECLSWNCGYYPHLYWINDQIFNTTTPTQGSVWNLRFGHLFHHQIGAPQSLLHVCQGIEILHSTQGLWSLTRYLRHLAKTWR